MKVIGRDFKRNLKGTAIWFIVFCILACFFAQKGIDLCKLLGKKQTQFIDLEENRPNIINNWRFWGVYGFSILQGPSPLYALFFKHGSGKKAFIDNGSRLSIERSENLNSIYSYDSIFDFSSFLTVFGSLLMLSLGYYRSKEKDYLRYLSNYTKSPLILLSKLLIAKVLLLVCAFVILILLVNLLLWFNGMGLGIYENILLASFFLPLIIFFLIVHFLGILGGSLKYQSIKTEGKVGKFFNLVLAKGGLPISFGLWAILLILLPDINGKSVYEGREKLENQKIQILMKFEKKTYEMAQSLDTKEERDESNKKMAFSFFDNDFMEILKLEKNYLQEIKKISQSNMRKSSFLTVSSIRLIGSEIASVGIISHIKFLEQALVLQKKFLKIYLEKAFNTPHEKVEPFLKDDENIIEIPGSLPGNYLLSISIGFGYFIIVFFLSLLFFKRLFFIDNKEIRDRMGVNLRPGVSAYFLTKCNLVADSVYAYMSEHKAFYMPPVHYFNNSFQKWFNNLTSALHEHEIAFTNADITTEQMGHIEVIIKEKKKKMLFLGSDFFKFINSKEQFYMEEDDSIKDIKI